MSTLKNTPKKPYVFISHSSKDNDGKTKQLLMHLLHTYPEHLWIDELNRQVGKNKDEYIKKAIQDASAFFVLLSKNAQDSSYIQKEYEWAVEKKRIDSEFHLIAIKLEKIEHSGFNESITFIDLSTPESCIRDMPKLIELCNKITDNPKDERNTADIILFAIIMFILGIAVAVAYSSKNK